MDYSNEEEDDYPDEDDEGGRRRHGGIRPSVMMRKLRRVSIISKSFPKIGSGRHSLAMDDNNDDDDDDSASSNDDSDDSSNSGTKGGFLKRKKQKKKVASKKKKKKEEKMSTFHKNPKRTLLRRSFHKEYGGMSRSAASRKLHLNVAGSGSQEDGDEEGDVPMPLPGQENTRSVRGDDYKTVSNRSINERNKSQKKIKKKASFATDNHQNDPGNNTNNVNNNKKRRSGSIRDALTSGDSHRGSHGSKSRRRHKQHAEDGSIDSPHSVASTDETSGDRQRQQLQQQSQLLSHSSYSRALSSNIKKNKSKRLVLKRQEGDENGLGFESEHHDFYYQSVIWILKSWMYFVTILIPFSLCYYMFVGIFQSTNISHNKLFQKIYFANILFYGNGCSWRGDFWARQSLDCKGSESTYGGVPSRINFAIDNAHAFTNQYNRTGSSGSRGKRLPRQTRSQDYRYSTVKGARRSTAAFRPQKLNARRKSMPTPSMPSDMMASNANGGTRNHLPQRTRAPTHRTSSMGPFMEHNNHATHISLQNNMRRKVANSSNANNSNAFGGSSAHSHKNSGSLTMNGSGHQSTVASVWDVEKILESTKTKPAGSARQRPKMDKTVSIMEIYDFHATDEKVAMLQ